MGQLNRKYSVMAYLNCSAHVVHFGVFWSYIKILTREPEFEVRNVSLFYKSSFFDINGRIFVISVLGLKLATKYTLVHLDPKRAIFIGNTHTRQRKTHGYSSMLIYLFYLI